jgi:hypothetical protein
LFNLSARIASALISRVCPEQPLVGKLNHSAGASTLAIHSLMVRAEGLLDEGTLAGTQAALAKWQEAIEIEPRYVRAICGVAQSYCEMALLTSSPIITANWEVNPNQRWVAPAGGGFGKIVHFGKLPVNIYAQVFRNVERPDGTTHWSARFQAQLLFPKKRKE